MTEGNFDISEVLEEAKQKLGTKDVGDVSGLDGPIFNWRCPSCLRNKFEILRLSKTGSIVGPLYRHHCHWGDYVKRTLPLKLQEVHQGHVAGWLRDHLCRFTPILICGDCNTADAKAKQCIGAWTHFSFSACEIGSFIVVGAHRTHEIDAESARVVYESVKGYMGLQANRLREIARDGVRQGSPVEHLIRQYFEPNRGSGT